MSVRLRMEIFKFISKEGDSTTGEIYDHLNKTKRNSVTMQQLTNLLLLERSIQKKNSIDYYSNNSRIRFLIWGLNEGVKPKVGKPLGCWKIYECSRCYYRIIDFKAHPPFCSNCSKHSKYSKKMIVAGWL